MGAWHWMVVYSQAFVILTVRAVMLGVVLAIGYMTFKALIGL